MLQVNVDLAESMHSYNIDSLLAIETLDLIGEIFGADVPISELVGGTSVIAVGLTVARKSRFRQAPLGTVTAEADQTEYRCQYLTIESEHS